MLLIWRKKILLSFTIPSWCFCLSKMWPPDSTNIFLFSTTQTLIGNQFVATPFLTTSSMNKLFVVNVHKFNVNRIFESNELLFNVLSAFLRVFSSNICFNFTCLEWHCRTVAMTMDGKNMRIWWTIERVKFVTGPTKTTKKNGQRHVNVQEQSK